MATEKYAANGFVVDDDWPVPNDIFEKVAPTPFPVGVLPTVMDEYAEAASESTGIDRGMLSMFGIGGANTALAKGFRICLDKAPLWMEPAIIWILAAGDPAIKKTPAMRIMMAPVEEQDELWMKRELMDGADHDELMLIYKKQHNKYITAKANGNPAEKPEKPTAPAVIRALVRETTIEGLRTVLAYPSVRGTAVYMDEMSSFFGGMDAYRGKGVNKDRGLWLQFYNGGTHSFGRADGSIYVPMWGGDIIGGIQPGPIRDISMKLQDDGLMQRFNVFLPALAGRGTGRPIDSGMEPYYRRAIMRLFTEPPQVLTFSGEAKEVFNEMRDFVHAYQQMSAIPTKLRTHIGKWEGMFARYAMNLHMMAYGFSQASEVPAEISAEAAQRAKELFMKYLLPHAMVFYTDVIDEGGGALEHPRWIAGYILSRGLPKIDRRTINQSYRAVRHEKPWVLDSAMRTLETYGWVRPVYPDTEGRPITTWFVNPLIHELFSDRAAKERARREEERELLKKLFEEMK